ncbi:MAG: hypothetical protein HWQ41_06690 [Nostoc sp. NOS(2021)]|nr:hypothetical protein [Nostoc sp. NOS(2021)]MBN3894950.1 hypothetical protein [Nostoc sp. NOS(2021)]
MRSYTFAATQPSSLTTAQEYEVSHLQTLSGLDEWPIAISHKITTEIV